MQKVRVSEVDEYDAVVVGARVAGATVAAFLGDAGYRVLLVDRGSFPSPALSTHFFRGKGMVWVLRDLGILDAVLGTGAPPLVRQYVYIGGEAGYAVEPPQEPGDIGYCLSVRRITLDDLLVRRATAFPTVELRERTRVVDLVTEGDRVVGARLTGPDGEQTVRARMVIGADGRHSGIARAVSAENEQWDEATRATYYCYVRGFGPREGDVPDGPEFSLRDDELAYVFPSEAGYTCLALSINLQEYTSLGPTRESRAAHLSALLDQHQGIGPRWHASTMEGGWLGAGPEPYYVRTPVGPGWALIGDAGVHQDPWSGFGMDMAGVQARWLAQALISWWRGDRSETDALQMFRRQRDEHALERYRTSVEFGRDLRLLAES